MLCDGFGMLPRLIVCVVLMIGRLTAVNDNGFVSGPTVNGIAVEMSMLVASSVAPRLQPVCMMFSWLAIWRYRYSMLPSLRSTTWNVLPGAAPAGTPNTFCHVK